MKALYMYKEIGEHVIKASEQTQSENTQAALANRPRQRISTERESESEKIDEKLVAKLKNMQQKNTKTKEKTKLGETNEKLDVSNEDAINTIRFGIAQ